VISAPESRTRATSLWSRLKKEAVVAKQSPVMVAIARAATLRYAHKSIDDAESRAEVELRVRDAEQRLEEAQTRRSKAIRMLADADADVAPAQHEIQQMRLRLELNAIPKPELDAEGGAEGGGAEGEGGGGGGGPDAAAFDELSAMQGEQ